MINAADYRSRVQALEAEFKALEAQYNAEFAFDFSEWEASEDEIDAAMQRGTALMDQFAALVDRVNALREDGVRIQQQAEAERDRAQAALDAAEAVVSDVEDVVNDADMIEDGSFERDDIQETLTVMEQRKRELYGKAADMSRRRGKSEGDMRNKHATPNRQERKSLIDILTVITAVVGGLGIPFAIYEHATGVDPWNSIDRWLRDRRADIENAIEDWRSNGENDKIQQAERALDLIDQAEDAAEREQEDETEDGDKSAVKSASAHRLYA